MIRTTSQAIQKKLHKLSVLPPGISILMQTLTDENISQQKLADTLERFPTIVIRLIALANSAWSAPLNPVTSLEMACGRLGFKVVRSVSIALAISAPFDPNRCRAFEANRFLSSSMLSAETACLIANLSARVESRVARTAGLLHNLGLLLLADSVPGETNEALGSVQQDPTRSVNAALREKCGIGYDEAGAMLGNAMDLPDSLVEVMACHRSVNPTDEVPDLISVVSVAREMVSTCYRQEIFTPDNARGLELGLGPEEQEAVFANLTSIFPKIQDLAAFLVKN